jgi:hypothetical protein
MLAMGQRHEIRPRGLAIWLGSERRWARRQRVADAGPLVLDLHIGKRCGEAPHFFALGTLVGLRQAQDDAALPLLRPGVEVRGVFEAGDLRSARSSCELLHPTQERLSLRRMLFLWLKEAAMLDNKCHRSV